MRAFSTSLVTVVAQVNYSLPATVRDVISVTVNGLPVDFVTEESLDNASLKSRGQINGNYQDVSLEWRTETGEARAAFLRGGDICLYPIPTVAGYVIGIAHKVNLTALADSASSYPLNTVERFKTAQMLLVLYTVIDLTAEEGDTTQMTTIKTEIDFFQGSIKRETQLGKKGAYSSHKGGEAPLE